MTKSKNLCGFSLLAHENFAEKLIKWFFWQNYILVEKLWFVCAFIKDLRNDCVQLGEIGQCKLGSAKLKVSGFSA